ncbi:MAG: pentapeptide repeat-containing protein [Desulfobacteraceae bacterium]|nr:pentapeptide repeat-containing protein [Desulfobacteraceae bacterium]
MPCCKAEKFKWCKSLDTTTSDDGKEYCVFHALEGQKGIAIEEFNELVLKRIEGAKDSGQKCDLSGTLFEGPISFNQYDEKNPLPFIIFREVTFIADADFRQVSFNEEVSFDKACFQESVSFSQVYFRGRVSFSEANFLKKAFWSGTIFDQEATFQLATFGEGAYFSDTIFNDSVNFRMVKFHGEAVVGGTFQGEVDFRQVLFGGDTEFRGTFNKEVSFWWSTFKAEADFRKIVFHKMTDFSRCSIEKTLLFVEVDLSYCSFLDCSIHDCQFIRCKWPRIRGREALYDEKKKASYGKVEELYRQLKWKYKEGHNEQETSRWHYSEKEMYRKKKWWRRFNPFSFSNLYWASSGYGERPVRAGIMLLLLFVSLVLFTSSLGLVSSSGKPVYGVNAFEGFSDTFGSKFFPELEKIGLIIYNTMQYALFFKTPYFKPETLSGDIILTIFTKLLMPIQAALFIFALRNRFRR